MRIPELLARSHTRLLLRLTQKDMWANWWALQARVTGACSSLEDPSGQRPSLSPAMLVLRTLLFCGLLATGFAASECAAAPRTKARATRLREQLYCGYERSQRPVQNDTTPVDVQAGMLLKYIVFYDKHDSLVIRCWMVWKWMDEHLVWDPQQYGGLDKIWVRADTIWVPDIIILNWIDWNNVSPGLSGSSKCLVDNKGSVMCVAVVTHDVFCSPDVTEWPHDTHECAMYVGSATQQGNKLSMSIIGPGVYVFQYESNPEWQLQNTSTNLTLNEFDNTSYPYLTFTLLLKRHSAAYQATVRVPALVLSALTLVTFWLDPSDSERLAILCMSTLAHCLYLQYLDRTVPQNSNVCPRIVLFFRDSLLLVGMAAVLTVLARKMATSRRPVPQWLAPLVAWLPGSWLIKLLIVDSPQGAAAVADDCAGLLDAPQPGPPRDWRLLAKLLDRVCFLAFAISLSILMSIFVS